MAQKNATPTKEQQAVLRKNGKDPRYYTVVKDVAGALIVRHRETREVEKLDK